MRPARPGERCLVDLGGPAVPGAVIARLADGTYKVELDDKPISFMPYWYGVPRERLALEGDAPAAAPPYAPLWWNQTRHGGRDPGSLPRAVTVEDALEALGVDGRASEAAHAAALASRTDPVPAALARLALARGAWRAIGETHPNNPQPLAPERWCACAGLRARGLSGDRALIFIEPHQGDHRWAAVFDPDEGDARVYAYDGDDSGSGAWQLAAPTVAFFLWDQAQTGLSWWQDTGFRGGMPVRATELGLARALA